MRIAGGVVATAAAFLAFTTTAAGAETFPHVNSYEAGTIVPPWHKVFRAAPDRMTVVPSPTDPSHNVMRVEMRTGDVYVDSGGARARAEVADRMGPDQDFLDYFEWPDYLQERWYGWRTYLESGFPPSGLPGWGTIITQWHSFNSDVKSPPFALVYDNATGKFELHRQGNPFTDWAGDATPGMWHTFLFHVKWSPLPGVGFAELWHNGVNVVPRTSAVTTVPDNGVPSRPAPVYLKQGIYRENIDTGTQVLYHDTMRIGETRAQVEP